MKYLVGALMVIAAIGCTDGGDRMTEKRSDPGSVTSTKPATDRPTVRLRIALPRRRLVSGESARAAVVITNRTGAPLLLQPGGCKPSFALVIGNNKVRQHVAFAKMCLSGALVVPTGRTRFPTGVDVGYQACSNTGQQGSMPACLPGSAIPPLPPGRYRVSFDDNGTGLPAPQPVPVQVVK